MLMRVPNPPVGPNEGLVCRLAPGSLTIIHASDSFLEFVGPTPPGQPMTLPPFLHDDDRALAEDEFRQAVELGERHDFVLRIQGRDGQWHYMRIFTQARYEPDGTPDHIRCFLKDVTDGVRADQELRRRTEQLTLANERLRETNQKLKETQGQLVHSEKLAALGTLAAGMAHEINNPLAFATNNMTVLGRDLATIFALLERFEKSLPALREHDPTEADALKGLCEEADLPYLRDALPKLVDSTARGLGRVAQIVKNLRAFAQLDRAEFGEIDVNESIEQGLSLLADLLSRQRIEVVRDLRPLPPLPCAPAHLNQVFLNLLMNAMQAIEATGKPSGQIGVSTRVEGGPGDDGESLIVEIRDDGCGIPAEIVPRIFDPFFTTKPIGRGSGLGLSLGHGIVADHGGTIEVESEVGVGTTFQVRLPTRGKLDRPRSRGS